LPGVLDNREIPRYSRQIVLRNWGLEKQKLLKASRVTIIGLGGLGTVVAPLLAKAGVGILRLVDDDYVEEVNMSAQLMHWDRDIGKLKIDSVEEKIKEMNPYVKVEKYNIRINEDNAEEILRDSTVVVDATDNIRTRGIINKTCVKLNIPFVHAGVRGFNGQLITIIPGKGPCLADLYHDFSGGPRSCPVVNATVSTIASIQAMEVIKLITGLGKPLVGRLLIFDGKLGDIDIVEVKAREDCPVCGKLRETS